MNIRAALDGTPLTLTSGGLRRYTEELFRALREEFPLDEYSLVSDQLKPAKSLLQKRWWSIGLPLELRRQQSSVFHGTDFAVPYVPVCASVMTIHDMSPWMNPEWHADAAVRRVRKRTPWLLRLGLATMLITPTAAVRSQIVDRFRIRENQIVVVPEAATRVLNVQHSEPERPYFLFVGTLEPRKNVPALVTAWRDLRRLGHNAELVIAGRFRADAPAIAPEPGLRLAGEVTDEELGRLYAGATALVYPSLYEGFGLPVIEAMQCGTPVITSRDPALMEVSGGAAMHVSAEGLTSAMESLLHNSELRLQLAEAGTRRASEYSWRRTAILTREVYAEAIRRFHGTHSHA